MSKGPMGARVLVVDDSPTIRKLVSAILAHHDYEPTIAADGPTALDLLRQGPVDLILLDFVMPRMNGYQFCIELRADPDLRNTPVVLMSAKGDKIRGQFVQQTGAVDAITKPFDSRALLAVVESALQKVADGRLPPSTDTPGTQDEIPVDVDFPPSSGQQVAAEPVEPLFGQALDEVAQKLASAISQSLDGSLRPSVPSVPVSRPSTASPSPVPSPPNRTSIPGFPAVPVSRPSTPSPFSARAVGSTLPPRPTSPVGAGTSARVSSVPVAARPLGSTPPRIFDPADLTGAVRRALTPSLFESIGPALRRLGLGTEPLSGETDVVPLAEVLQVLQLQRQTGTCRVQTGHAEVTICFRDGLIDLALGRGAVDEFRLGRYLVEEGLVTREDLDRTLDHQGMTQRRMGEALIGAGLITETDLRRALSRQTSELVYEVLRWPKARFGFTKEVIEQPEGTRLGLPVASIVMEGFRRVDEWRLIEETIQFDQVLMRNQVALDSLGTNKLSRQEQLVLDAIDGERSVREILSNIDVGSFDACKILYQFLQSRLVRQRAA